MGISRLPQPFLNPSKFYFSATITSFKHYGASSAVLALGTSVWFMVSTPTGSRI